MRPASERVGESESESAKATARDYGLQGDAASGAKCERRISLRNKTIGRRPATGLAPLKRPPGERRKCARRREFVRACGRLCVRQLAPVTSVSLILWLWLRARAPTLKAIDRSARDCCGSFASAAAAAAAELTCCKASQPPEGQMKWRK